jgi:hypothetical protein
MTEKKRKALRNIDVRLLYILPSLLALVIAFTAFAYQFGNEIVDLKNTCYTIYMNTPEDRAEDEMIEELDEMLVNYDISGFTINLNTQGAYVSDGKIQLDNSLQIAFMDIARDTVYKIAEDLRETYGVTIMIQESVVKVSYL